MSSSETERLNFYSKYNRVRDKQDIDSLYALINTELDHALVFTLASSRLAPSPPPPPVINHANEPLLPSLAEHEQQERRRAVEEKLRKLAQMERNFHQQLQRSEREQRKKEQARESKRREREQYRHHLINVVEHTSENSHPQPQPAPPSPQPALPVDDYDDYYCGVEVEMEIKEESEFDMRETRRKIKEIIEMQRRREREVESVEENNDAKASSIVIERLAIAPKHVPPPSIPKESRNYYQVELSHSQSANVLRSIRSEERLDIKEHIAEEQQEDLYNPGLMNYEEVNLNYDAEQTPEQQEPQQSDQQQEQEVGEEDFEQEEQQQSQADYAYDYEQSEGIEPPLTLTQNDHPLTAQDASELTEEIADHVVSIGDLSDQQSQPPQHTSHRGPLFHSQAHPRHSFHSQQEVQSIAESIDYHPLEGQADRQNVQDQDRKTSFKKLMAENRANLIPRLAISTILNEHINEALAGPPPALPPPNLPPPALHESIISSEGSTGRAAKVNFKSLLRKNKPTSNSRVEVPRDPVKAQTNKKLLASFFDEN